MGKRGIGEDAQAGLTACAVAEGAIWAPLEIATGLDTVSLSWPGGEALSKFHHGLRAGGLTVEGSSAPLRVRPGPRGLFAQADGAALGVFDSGSLWIECRGGRLLASEGLLPPASLLEFRAAATGLLNRLGLDVNEASARVRRADLASDIRFGDGIVGDALLRCIASFDVPRRRRDLKLGGGGALETVYLRTASGVVKLRAYDKGMESGGGERGRWIRVERQVRFERRQRPSVEDFLAADLGQLWLDDLAPWADAAVAHAPLDVDATESALTTALHNGTISARTFERLIGAAMIFRSGLSDTIWSPSIRCRRRIELRALGLGIAAEGVSEQIAIPTGLLLGLLRSAWVSSTAERAADQAKRQRSRQAPRARRSGA